MSQTQSLGEVDAGRWIGVAASLVEYLQAWLTAEQAPPPFPRGIFAGARRFLTYALEGIYLDRRQRREAEIPIMAGISNLGIARGVFRRLPNHVSDATQVETDLNNFLECLKTIESGGERSEPLRERAKLLQLFFQELCREGSRARHTAFAHAEAPSPRD